MKTSNQNKPQDQDHHTEGSQDLIGLGISYALGSVFLFAMMNVLIKLLSEGYSVIQLLFARNLFALIPIMYLVHSKGGFGILKTTSMKGHLQRSSIGMIAMLCSFLSFAWLPLADATAIHFAAPIIMTALSVPLLGEHVGAHRWGAVIIGFIGVVILSNPSGHGDIHGITVALLAALFAALAQVKIRKLSKTERSISIVFYFTIISTLFSAMLLPFFWTTPTGTDLMLMALMGVIGGVAQYLMTQGYSFAPAAIISPFNYTSIIFATLFGYLIWQQIPQTHTMIGGTVVITSGLYILYREMKHKISLSRVNIYSMQPTRPSKPGSNDNQTSDSDDGEHKNA